MTNCYFKELESDNPELYNIIYEEIANDFEDDVLSVVEEENYL